MRNRLLELVPGSHAPDTDIVIEPSLAGAAAELLSRAGFAGRELLVVCDANSYAALGSRLIGELSGFRLHLLTLHSPVHADMKTVKTIASCPGDALLAVGSGTLNDLCKYASFQGQKPYAIFPTAPSMNGYLSINASLVSRGVKSSHHAHIPAGVFCDLDVISAAPRRLIQSGLGDSLCRATAQADWLLSHQLLDTFYSSQPFEWLRPYEAELFTHADKLVRGDSAVIEMLMKTLLISGLGMTFTGGSYPASQGEHMIAHTMEMKYGDALPPTFHGEQIGVATLTMAALQEDLLSRPLTLPPLPEWEQALERYFGLKRGKILAKSSAAKYALYAQYDGLNAKLREGKNIIERLRQVMVPERSLRYILEKAQAPTSSDELGWAQAAYRDAVKHAAFTRDRFTFLDCLN